MKRQWIALSLPFLLLTACKASVPAESAAESPAPAAPAKSAPATPAAQPATDAAAAGAAIDAGFAKGMPYADLRRRVLAAGWLPLVDPSCRENIGGDASICFSAPELEACSGDGHCNMHFADAASGREIAVHTYGPIERWNAPGEEKSLAVTGWEVSAIPAQKPSVACPSQDFDAFLKAYGSDESVRAAYTAPLVQVAQLTESEDGDASVQTYSRGDQYDGFLLQYRDGWFLPVAERAANPTPVKIAVTTEKDGSRYVTVPGNMEGISYRFAQKDGCWRLTADPDVVP